MLDVTIPDGPAPAGTLSIDGTGVGDVVSNSCHGFIHFALLYVRVDGKQIVPM